MFVDWTKDRWGETLLYWGFWAEMKVAELIDGFENASSQAELQLKMQLAIESFGFSAYNFMDVGKAHLENPYFFGTTGLNWENEYRSNNFLQHDHTLSHARRSNLGFNWLAVPLPPQIGKKKSGSLRLMEAAHDYGFNEGYILPFHFADDQGRHHTAVAALYWKDSADDMAHNLSLMRKHQLELVMLYFIQRIIALKGSEMRKHSSFTQRPVDFSHLTDRERQTLTWAGRGRSAIETSKILNISQTTVKGYLVQAMTKLEAVNKTHAVAKAVHLGLIDI